MFSRVMIAALLASALASHAAAAAAFRLIPLPAAGQTLGVVGAKPAMVSKGASSEALLILETEVLKAGGLPAFRLAVHNPGQATFTIKLADVAATTDAGAVRVLGVTELVAISREDVARALRANPPAAGHVEFARQIDRQNQLVAAGGRGQAPPSTNVGARAEAAADQLLRQGTPTGLQPQVATAYLVAEEMATRAAFKPLEPGPGASVSTPLPLSRLPAKVTRLEITVSAAGERHVFAYRLEKQATAPPR